MKSLSLSRPLVILVIGLPGSGKSFFARKFADMFSAPLVNADYIRSTVFPHPAFSPAEDGVVYGLAQNEVNELLKTGKTFVIDGGVNSRAARLNLERQAAVHGYGRLTVWVQTDEPTSLARSVKRQATRSGDEHNAPMDSQAFTRYKKQFNAPTVRENVIVISGKHTYATQARIVLKKLVSPRDTTSQQREALSPQPDQQVESTNDIQPRRRNLTIN